MADAGQVVCSLAAGDRRPFTLLQTKALGVEGAGRKSCFAAQVDSSSRRLRSK